MAETLLDEYGLYDPLPRYVAPLAPSLVLGEATTVTKSTTQEFTGTSLAAVDDLSFPLIAGESYLIEAQVIFTAGGTGGAKFSFTSGGGTHVLRGTLNNWSAPEDSVNMLLTSEGSEVAFALPAADHSFELDGVILSATGGTLQITAAQNSANDALNVFAGSYLRVTRIE